MNLLETVLMKKNAQAGLAFMVMTKQAICGVMQHASGENAAIFHHTADIAMIVDSMTDLQKQMDLQELVLLAK